MVEARNLTVKIRFINPKFYSSGISSTVPAIPDGFGFSGFVEGGLIASSSRKTFVGFLI